MKKIFAICFVAMLFAAGTVGARKPFHAPKTMNEVTSCDWDSSYYFMEDSLLSDKKVIQEIDTVNKTMLVYGSEWYSDDQVWGPLHVYKYFYDNQGRLILLLESEPTTFEQYEFTDSTIYTYGNQERIEVEYSNMGTGYYMSDSIHYTLDANGNDIEKVETEFSRSGEVLMTEKVDFTYDAASGLLLTEATYRDVDSQWVAKEAYSYTVNDGKYTSGIYYDFRITDTLEAYTYQYQGTTEMRYELEKEDGVWAAVPDIRKTTYNECGFVETVDEYEYDEDAQRYEYEEGERHFFTKVSTAVEDVTEEPAVRDEVVVKKYMINGQLFIERNGITYDAQGRIVRQ